MMFEWPGFHHLERVLYNVKKNGDFGQFATRVRDLFKRAEQPRIASKCQCGATAKYIAARIRLEGVAFFSHFCGNCKAEAYEGTTLIKLVFSSVDCFQFAADKKMFLIEMRRACGLSSRITADEAHAVFYPPAHPAVQPSPKPATLPKPIPAIFQLPLFNPSD
jgi:hypothetical protein